VVKLPVVPSYIASDLLLSAWRASRLLSPHGIQIKVFRSRPGVSKDIATAQIGKRKVKRLLFISAQQNCRRASSSAELIYISIESCE
jgi:hypothetical protein